MFKNNQVFVIAAPGRRVKDPYTMKLLKEEGEWKPVDSYWLRRMQFGDVIEGSPSVEVSPPPFQEEEPSSAFKNKKHKE